MLMERKSLGRLCTPSSLTLNIGEGFQRDYVMAKGKDLKFDHHLHRLKNLSEKLSHFEKYCGSGKIHDLRGHLNTINNWIGNLKFYSTSDVEFEMWEHGDRDFMKKFSPSQNYIDEYFAGICSRAEAFLSENVKGV
jgi:hypothetical protein